MGGGKVGAVVAAIVAALTALFSAPAPEPRTTPPTVLVVGDSLVRDAAGALRGAFAGHGVETHVVINPGEGLLTDQARWNRQITDAVTRLDPDVVVIEACCDYDPKAPYVLPSGETIQVDTEAMFQQWSAVARDAVRRARARGAAVHWVLTPDPAPNTWFGWLEPRIDRLNGIYEGLGVPLVDWRGAVASAPAVRGPDGLHLTDAGNRLLADVTWKAIAPDVG